MPSRATIFSASTVLALAGLTVLLPGDSSDRREPAPFVADTQDFLIPQRTRGSSGAPITVFEMSDFQCPFCRRHAVETWPELERLYVETGKVRWIFINFPIPQLHANATAAAELGMCAARAGKFWPVHDLLFKYQEQWGPLKDPAPFLLTLADSAGIGRKAILPCLNNHETLQLVKMEAEEAARAGVRSTPTFIIEGGLMRGAAPLEVFRGILDSIYTAKLRAR
jgi:protein-disulfide isomerase